MRENSVAKKAALDWFAEHHGAGSADSAWALTGHNFASLLSSVVQAFAEHLHVDDEAKHETTVNIDMDIATVIDRAVEREFMRAERAEGALEAVKKELAAVRKSFAKLVQDCDEAKGRADRNFVMLGNVERQLNRAIELADSRTSRIIELQESIKRAYHILSCCSIENSDGDIAEAMSALQESKVPL